MAREYSPYACNLYIGCSHRCKYCYAPHTLQRTADGYFGVPSPRKDILKNIEKELQAARFEKQILLSFIGDIYCHNSDSSATTRRALELFSAYKAPVAVLSKGGKKCLRDLDIFKTFENRIAVGATLTFCNEEKSKIWEAGAALPSERLDTLKELRRNGTRTFASFEPVIEPAESLKLIEKTLEDDSVDHYKIGKLNNYIGLDKGVDWQGFLRDVLALLRPAKKQIYIKHCLRILAPGVELSPEEKNPEQYIVRI